MTELLSHHWCTGKLIFDFATHIWPDQEMTAMSHYDFVKFEQRYLAKWRETELTVADKDLEVSSHAANWSEASTVEWLSGEGTTPGNDGCLRKQQAASRSTRCHACFAC